MKYKIIAPPKTLQKYVRYFSILDYDNGSTGSSQIKVFADCYPHLVFQHSNGRSAFFKHGKALPITFMSGIKTIPYTCDINNTHSVTTVTFYPQAIKSLFGIDPGELNNELPDIQNFAPEYLTDLLVNTASHSERITILCNFLLMRLTQLKPEDALIVESIRLLTRTNIETSLTAIQKYFKISERQFERRFESTIGLLPKQYLRATRFEKSLMLIQGGSFKKLSDIAFDLNFTDQSHFIKEFKEFSGFTPKSFMNQNKILEDSSTTLNQEDGLITLSHLITS